ncbi:prohormone-3-like [Oppia nitens]|uniref:prohormone-3-like n=1 Tax=Oppia nitens TaxID=1686743 RepID=UPI0023DBE720|nr:prohormone-3-like [Oppia nitens]
MMTNCWENKPMTGFQSNLQKNAKELETLLSEGQEKCINKRCVQSEQCCPGSVCVDLDLNQNNLVAGTCLPIYGVNEGQSCRIDNDCEPGLRCLDSQPVVAMRQKHRTCQPPGRDMMKKQYNDQCVTSSECDASHGLCCQLIRRYRMSPKRLCYYFSDANTCIGSVDVTFAKPVSAVTSGAFNNRLFKARIG